ncbi:SCP2 sterol-binding domain-containing protein [Laceyella putida]|uniref:SCP2 sterol-binding domain-containing protein n=1 Tax=Laceyella putida TaxID=110101 RepID=A0ABW2RHA7_9BACL
MGEEFNLDKVFSMIERVLGENPKSVQGINAIYQYDLSGDDGATFQLHLTEGRVKAEKGAPAEADCILQMSVRDFKDMLLGNISGTAAFMSGKLKIKGNIGLAMKMEKILRQYDVSQYI